MTGTELPTMKKISVDEILEQNRHVDPEKLKEAQQLSEKLKEAGFEAARYRLATPLTGRRHRDQTDAKHADQHAHHLVRRH
jgi:isopentenyl diphosphate isomerase/L-lactate dehydrogenase-like FMN-dependent dehydrogenase